MLSNSNLVNKDIYIQLKAILEGCDTIIDAFPFCNAYADEYPNLKSMIVSVTNGKKYKDNIDINTKQVLMNNINNCTTRDEALDMISNVLNRSTDDVYIKTMERLAHKKYYRNSEYQVNTSRNSFGNTSKNTTNNINKNINKKCPHCNFGVTMPENTYYIICGYHNTITGFNWDGCGRDWCFHCGKMLCKHWITNSLNIYMNRTHDNICCSNHAVENGYNYPEDYCQCNNMNVHRENILNNLLQFK